MTIIRVEKKDNYSILPNAAINDKRLSLEARGLLVFLLSKPNDWRVNSRALTNISPAGRDKIRRILRELEQFGYLERRRFQGKDGKFEWESVVREQPLTEDGKTTAEENSAEAKEATAEENSPASQPEPKPETMDGKPDHGKPETMDGFSVDGSAVDGSAVDGKPVPLTNTELTNTERLNTRYNTTTITTTNARAPVAAAVVADLPDEIKRALKALGWVGSVAEISRAWAENPNRVRAWLDHALRHGWRAALLRHTLRTDPGLPPEPDAAERARWLAEREALARYQASGGGDGREPPPEATVSVPQKAGGAAPVPVSTPQEPPDMATTPPTATTNPDTGVAGAGNGASAAREHPPPALPPDVQRWWNAAVGQLQTDDGMTKAAFDAWVRPASPVAWQDENGGAVLTVAVANDYARRWLEERVATILARKLTGFAGRPVTLNIVVE